MRSRFVYGGPARGYGGKRKQNSLNRVSDAVLTFSEKKTIPLGGRHKFSKLATMWMSRRATARTQRRVGVGMSSIHK